MSSQMNAITLTINGKVLEVQGPIKVLEAARQHGIEIPTMCYYPKIESFGGCRMCLVEVKGKHRLQASCSLPAEDGMVIETETPEIHASRKAMLEFMLINHPLDCPTCDKAGECDLQDFSMIYGAGAGRFSEPKRTDPESLADPLIVRNMERCIMCTKCVRVCDELQGSSAINVIGRGKQTSIEPFSGTTFDCDYCGQCIIACPVGALMSKLHRHKYRPWDTESQVDSVCSHCGVGCGVHLQIRQGALQRLIPAEHETNEGILCAKGFFGYEYIGSPKRLTTPLARKDGRLTPVSWDEAFSLVINNLTSIRDSSGGEALAAMASPMCTLEDNYMLQKLMRAGLGTNNIDSASRLGLAGLRRIVTELLGHERTVSYVKDIADCDAVLVACCDPCAEAPVAGVRVRNAFHNGAEVITLGHAPGLKHHRSIALEPGQKSEALVLGAILSAVLELKARVPGDSAIDPVMESLELPPPEELGHLVDAAEIRRAANMLINAEDVSMITGRGIVCTQYAPWSIIVFAALAHMLDAKIYLVSDGPGEHGLLDMGCEPDTLPGPALLSDEKQKALLEKVWGNSVPDKPGLSLMEIVEGASSGDIKGLYVMGSNPSQYLPDSEFVSDALEGLDFLVVQDIFMTETADMADVVLPAMAWFERGGTYVNMERRLRRMDSVVPGKGLEDWKILSGLCELMGIGPAHKDLESIFSEISDVSSLYSNATASKTDEKLSRWPYGGDGKVSSSGLLDSEGLRAHLKKPRHLMDDGLTIINEPSLLVPGALSRYSDALVSISPDHAARISSDLASQHDIETGNKVRITTTHGKIEIIVSVDKDLPDNTLLFPNKHKCAGLLKLLRYNRLPIINALYLYTEKTGLIYEVIKDQ